jgi:hypothetical protein
MAAPQFVPVPPLTEVRTYESPPRRPDSWRADRPGDHDGPQELGDRFGAPGPDQGYALKVADELFRPRLILGDVHADDAVAGCVGVALKRAALFGRAPTTHDLRAAFRMWGFLDVSPDPGLVELRDRWFAEVAHPHHYAEQRRIVDAVSDDVLRRPHADIESTYAGGGWRDLIDAP